MLTRNPDIAKIGEEILPFEMTRIPEFFQRKAETELRDTPERRAQGLRQIKEMAKNDKVTRDVIFSDDFLLQYLRCRKYNVAKAFSQLKAFVNLRRKFPQIFCNFRYENIVTTMTKKIVTVLPWRCQDGCAILFIELDNWNPDEFPVEEVKRMVVLMLLQSLREPMTQINGFKVIFDVKSNPLRHLRIVYQEDIKVFILSIIPSHSRLRG
uniref:Clavesin-1 n=1 Tax=Parasteatoda tepidariorum TaxID=114398 RepID=A0A2L2XYC1_PARTP